MFFGRLRNGAALVAAAIQILFVSSGSAGAVTLDLWYTTGNGTSFGDNYSVSGSVVQARTASAPGSVAGIDGVMGVWALNFSDLHGVTYSGSAYGDIGVLPTGAIGITLYGFDLGSWDGVDRTPQVRIWNGDYTVELTSPQNIPVGATHAHYTTSLFSANGFHIQFSTIGGNIGIDNLEFDVGNLVTTPLPAAAWMFVSGLGALGMASARSRRRRKRL